MRLAALILAGGRSSRMQGRDKALLPLQGRPLLARILERLSRQVEAIAINTNADPTPFQPFGRPIVPDTIPGYAGPLAGVLAGLEWASPGYDAILTAAVDTPFLPPDLAARLVQANGPAVTASAGRSHPVVALWPAALRGPLRHFLAFADTARVTAFQEQVGFRTVDFPLVQTPAGLLDPFLNINTPEDLERAETFAATLP